MSIFQITVKAVAQAVTQLRNVHHYEFFGYTPDTTQLQEAVDAVDAAYKTNLQAVHVNDVNYYAYDVRQVDVGGLPSVEYTATAGSWSGSSVVDPMPTQLSALCVFKTLTTFPRSSRTYLFPFSENANSTQGILEAATQTSIGLWATAMLTLAITGGLDADKVAVEYGGVPRAVVASNDLTSFKVNPIWGTQRRRRVGVGI